MVTFSPRRQSLAIPPLENGDRLSRPEFEQRYAAMPDVKKAELIEGTVYMASPLRFEPHAEPHADIIGWLWTYKVATPGIRLGDNPTVRLDRDSEPQPDAMITGNLQQVIVVLQPGLASQAHQDFLANMYSPDASGAQASLQS